MIEAYRLILAPHLGGACRFTPSCSEYARQAFLEHPPLHAFGLTLKRLGRCRPGGPWGWDPVPESESCSCNRGHHEFAK